MFINYSDLPNYSNLFLDYVYEFDKVKDFYIYNFRNQDEYARKFSEITSSKRIFPETLSKILFNQYADVNSSKRTISNINYLGQQNSVAIVTGQQLTIFGGPLYTFYKIITAIKLCIQLKDKFVDYNFIPVFWLEGDDHDFNEVRSINIFNNDNEIQKIEYLNAVDNSMELGSVGNLLLEKEIELTLQKLKDSLRNTEFTEELISFLSKTYKSGNSFKKSFKHLLMKIFDEYGLVIIDPQDVELKKLLIPIFESELINYREHTQTILKRSALLEEKYHAQVKVKPINIFLIDDSKRFLIEPDENGYKLKNRRKKFSKEEILNLLYQQPELFSPNVLLRPLCQDYILPTAFYVGGPSEISYFAQLIPYYSKLNIIQPFIYPRASITLVEKNIKSLLDKYQINLLNIFQNGKQIIPDIIASSENIDTNKFIREALIESQTLFEKLNNNLSSIDPSIAKIIEKLSEKNKQSIESLKSKLDSIILKKNEIIDRQLNKIFSNIIPNNNLQEREINFTYYFNKYGKDLINFLFNEVSTTKFEHQVLEVIV